MVVDGLAHCLLSSPFVSVVTRSPCFHVQVIDPRNQRCGGARRRWLTPEHKHNPFHHSKRLLVVVAKRGVRSKHFFGDDDKGPQAGDSDSGELDAKSGSNLFMRWNIPWDGKTVITTMTAFGISFLLTGLGLSILIARLGFRRRQLLDFDEQALFIFINQLLQTIVGTNVINACIKSYRPFPTELFYYDWKNPFSVSRGWLLWGLVGIFCGAAAVLLAGTVTTFVNGEPLPREGQDALLQLLPLIGASRTSTALLLAVTGLLAPYLEETVFRGFLMTSLTKWMPTPAAVILSAGAFAFAHFTPGEIPQLFALGVVLGFSYSKSGNLLTPIMIHGLWNSGVVILLTFLRLQGYDIQELI